MFKLLLILLAFFQSETNGISIPILSDIQDIIGLAHDISDIASGNVPFLSWFTGAKPDPVQTKLAGLSKQIEELTNLFNVKLDNALTEILTNVPRETDFRARMATLNKYITRVNFLYENYRRLIEPNNTYSQFSIDQFIDSAASLHEGDILETLNQMHSLFVNGPNSETQESFLQVAVGVFMEMKPANLCGKRKSQQQRLFDIYRTVAITEIKGFIMNTYAYGLLGIYDNMTYTEEIQRSKERLLTRMTEYLIGTKAALKGIPRDIYICDPSKHEHDETFTELRRAIQRTVYHEWMLRSEKSCYGSCSDINTSTVYRNFSNPNDEYGPKKNWAPVHSCEGRINECQDLGETDLCEMEGIHKERFVYVKSNNLGTYGSKMLCFMSVKSHLETFMWNVRWCEPCICTCTEEKKTSTADRAFSFRKQRSDLDRNMVVTGIRFQEMGDEIHLQIEQGKLIANGAIEENSTEWVELEDLKYKNDSKYWQGGYVLVKDGKEYDLIENEDYTIINYDRRQVQLGDVKSLRYPDYVVTGARLALSWSESDAITIYVRFTKFNYTTGEFISEEDDRIFKGDVDTSASIPSYWVQRDWGIATEGKIKWELLDVKGKIDPVKSYGNVPDSEGNHRIKFTHSSDEDDLGQSTIPYIDLQTVAPEPRVALDGLGLYHRGNGVSGGFISLKVVTHDMSLYLNPVINPNLLREGELEKITAQQTRSQL